MQYLYQVGTLMTNNLQEGHEVDLPNGMDPFLQA